MVGKPLCAVAAATMLASGGAGGQAPGFTVTRDIPYGDLPRQRLDLYTPDEVDDTTPVVVHFFAGGWTTGSKGASKRAAQALARDGVIVVAPDHGL